MKGICFKEPLFHKVVAGTKNQTRRLIKIPEGYKYEREGPNGLPEGPSIIVINDAYDRKIIYPRYKPGETVYLKEPYHLIRKYPNAQEEPNCKIMIPEYAFDKQDHIKKIKNLWKNKLFMKADYARYFIKITGVGVERAHSISEADIKAEGLQSRLEFENWWIKINGFSSWAPNPWVWVYQLELINKPILCVTTF